MPSGRVHSSVSAMMALYTGAAATTVFAAGVIDHPAILVVPAGCILGILIGPDLDVDDGNISYAIIRKRVGSWATFLWSIYWRPYAKIIPHRSVWSHMPFTSTVLRVVYGFWWLALIASQISADWLLYWPWAVAVFAGLLLSDFSHWFMDWTVDGW